MQKQLASVLLALALALVACAGPASSVAAANGVRQGVREGDLARDFTLKTLAGVDKQPATEVSLLAYRGSVVLINFWATWCQPCTDEIPDLEAAYEARQEDGFVVLGVNHEQLPAEIEPFVTALQVTYPILVDESGRVLRLYRGVGLPMSVIVDREGVIRVRHVGYLPADQLDRYLAELLP